MLTVGARGRLPRTVPLQQILLLTIGVWLLVCCGFSEASGSGSGIAAGSGSSATTTSSTSNGAGSGGSNTSSTSASGSTVGSGSGSAVSGSGTSSSSPTTPQPTPNPAGTPSPGGLGTAAPDNSTASPPTDASQKTKQTIEWYIIVIAIGLVFGVVGASCYVTLMWQQKALRDYKGKFEELLKDSGMQRRMLEDEVEKREEERALEAEEEGDMLGGDFGGGGGVEALERKLTANRAEILASSEPEKRKKGREAFGAKYDTQQLTLDNVQEDKGPSIKREPLATAKRGPMMVRWAVDHDHLARQNATLAQLKAQNPEGGPSDGRPTSTLQKSLSLTAGAHRNLSSLKSSSQLKNIASLV